MTELQARLRALAEPDYQTFASRLLPGVDNLLGVRIPHLRKLARQLAREDWRAALTAMGDGSFEEVLLQGLLIGCAKGTPAEILPHVAAFVPKIDNWSICDSFCSSLKLAAAYPEPVWDFLLPYLGSGREFSVRFAVVMLLFYYLDEAHIDRVLSLLDGVRQPDYYARMAVAWAVSIAYVRFPEKTLAYLQTCSLDDFTYNKALQKAVESRCVGEPARSVLRAMKR